VGRRKKGKARKSKTSTGWAIGRKAIRDLEEGGAKIEGFRERKFGKGRLGGEGDGEKKERIIRKGR